MIHHATLNFRNEGETFYWVSLNGETWIPVNRPPEPEDEESIERLFEGDNGFRPMVFTRAWLVREGAKFGGSLKAVPS